MGALTKAIDGLAEALSLAGLPTTGSCSIGFEIGEDAFRISIVGGFAEIQTAAEGLSEADFVYMLSDSSWAKFCSDPPPRGYTTAQAMCATVEGGCVRGNRTAWATYAPVVDRVLGALRGLACGFRPASNPDPPLGGARSPITGGYLNTEIRGIAQRIYYEVSGQGQPVLCLHTAGADSRQFRYLLEDTRLIAQYRFIAFDMPWHGRSDPPDDWATTDYQLDTQTYSETILAVMDELGLQDPILIGCSMGGAIALYMASTYGERFKGVCALEGGLGNPGRFVPWTNHLEVDHSHFLTSWVGGLISPNSPTGPRNQTLWGYAQSGPGVYQGDTYFYSNDFPKYADLLGPAKCPLWVFSGEFDYSATTEMSMEAAKKLGGKLLVMAGGGHFPMSEDPVTFRNYLVPVLEEISAPPTAATSRRSDDALGYVEPPSLGQPN